jgi:hypothetical protein
MVTKPPKGADVKKKDVEKVVPEPLQDVPQEGVGKDVHQIFRTLSASGGFIEGQNVHPADVVDDYLNSWLQNGYELIYVQHIRTVMAAESVVIGEQMLYVMLRK